VLAEASIGDEVWTAWLAELGSRVAAITRLLAIWPSREAVLSAVLDSVRVRPGFAAWVARARARGDTVTVVSAGAREVIDAMLAECAVTLPVVARRGNFGAGPDPPHGSLCELCGEPCKRSFVLSARAASAVHMVGDGVTDLCGARAADRVWAVEGSPLHRALAGLPGLRTLRSFDDLP
jgi:2-hydroxy-3-keto-5-methylthiopentenyl-1-phosphate phosphatase